MSKKKEAVVKEKKKASAPKGRYMKVSKSVKIMATMAAVRGGNKRAVIRALGEADDSYKATGRLILGSKAE